MDDVVMERFSPHLGSEFVVISPIHDDESVALRLTDVSAAGGNAAGPRAEPFTLIFSGPARPILDQRIYRLEHPDLGVLEIFLVPIGYDPSGSVLYEAVFN